MPDSTSQPETTSQRESPKPRKAHDHTPCSGHSHGGASGGALIVSLAVTVAFVAGEAIAGFVAHSLALISDAGHNFSDALSLGLSAYAVWIAQKPANSRKTFGYHRVAILAALANSASLAVLSIGIMWGAAHSLAHPSPIDSPLMIGVAAVALVVNGGITWALHGGAQHSLNMRATYIHMATDVLSSVLVLAAAFAVRYTGLTILDPLVSIVIAVIILASCWNILREATDVLLEGAPRGLNVDAMIRDIQAVRYVKAMHDLHVWTVSDGLNYLSCHIIVDESRSLSECSPILAVVNRILKEKYGIGHTTIQVELAGLCAGMSEPVELYCGGGTAARLPFTAPI